MLNKKIKNIHHPNIKPTPSSISNKQSKYKPSALQNHHPTRNSLLDNHYRSHSQFSTKSRSHSKNKKIPGFKLFQGAHQAEGQTYLHKLSSKNCKKLSGTFQTTPKRIRSLEKIPSLIIHKQFSIKVSGFQKIQQSSISKIIYQYQSQHRLWDTDLSSIHQDQSDITSQFCKSFLMIHSHSAQ